MHYYTNMRSNIDNLLLEVTPLPKDIIQYCIRPMLFHFNQRERNRFKLVMNQIKQIEDFYVRCDYTVMIYNKSVKHYLQCLAYSEGCDAEIKDNKMAKKIKQRVISYQGVDRLFK